LIIHYGKTAFTSTSTTDTIYVFGKNVVEVENLVKSYDEKYEKKSKTLMLLDVDCYHIVDSLIEAFKDYNVVIADLTKEENGIKEINKTFSNTCFKTCSDCGCANENPANTVKNSAINSTESSVLANLNIGDFPKEENEVKTKKLGIFSINTDLPLEEFSLFFIGNSESETLKNVLLQEPCLTGHVYDVSTSKCSSIMNSAQRKLKQRYLVMQKVKDAQRIGILVGTMGMSGYKKIISHLKNIIRKSGRQSYTIIVGKPNVAKLANFSEIDLYVLVACPEQTFVDDPKEFLQPIATPYEVEVALNKNREWSIKNYITDFRRLLPGGKDFVEFEADVENHISMIDGGMKGLLTGDDSESSAVALSHQNNVLSVFHPHASARFLMTRSWKGLEINGNSEVKGVQVGKDGIATSYKYITE